MPYTFECGTCSSTYRLDEHQITAEGIKVTCPKCLSFFFLKRGSRDSEKPIVEFVSPESSREGPKDGPRELPKTTASDTTEIFADINIKLPEEGITKSSSSSTKSKDVSPTSTKPPFRPPTLKPPESLGPPPSDQGPSIEDTVKPTEKGYPETSHKQITHHDLTDLPDDHPGDSKFLSNYVVPISSIILVAALLLLLNFRGIIRIPGLAGITEEARKPKVIENEDREPEADRTPKYGFPQVDPGYDPWKE